MNKKRLCLVIPSLQPGGMERVMSELTWYFSNVSELEVHLVLYGITREIFYPVPENIVVHVPSFPFNNKVRLFHTIRTLAYLRNKIKEIKPVSILSFGEIWNSFVLLSVLGLDYPVYISDRCSPEKRFSRIQELLRKLLYPYASGIVAQTLIAKQIYSRQSLNSNICVIGNPIRRIPAGEENKKENVVLMVGRLINSKNQDKLIEIFLQIHVPGWRLVIVGYDHLQQKNYDRLKNIIEKNNASDRVSLEGKQADVDSYYRKCKIFASTSTSEGFPNVIGEAMSAGVPVVSFDCVAGPSEMIKDNHNGFLIPVADYTLFREKLEKLMTDEDLRKKFSKHASDDIKKFSANEIGQKYLEFVMNKTY